MLELCIKPALERRSQLQVREAEDDGQSGIVGEPGAANECHDRGDGAVAGDVVEHAAEQCAASDITSPTYGRSSTCYQWHEYWSAMKCSHS